jgi:putative YhdH/YhfP family quinone oxidoreductase
LTKAGFEVVAVTGKEDQVGFLKELGASEIILRKDIDLENKRPLGKGLYAGVIDTVGGNILSEFLKVLLYDGVATCCGLTAGINFTSSVFPFILRGVRLIGIDSVECSLEKKEHIWKKLANEWKIENLDSIGKIISIDEIEENYQTILQGKVVGRVVVKLD